VKRLLVVSPHFPPINAPDMHRVRMSLPFYEECGWQPHVLTIEPAYDDGAHDPALLRSLPDGLAVTRVRALPARWTRKIGVGNLALRALPYLHAAGKRILGADSHDLVFFSTSMFPAMTLGRRWRQRFGVPYVVDMQDPWLTTYYEGNPGVRRPPKYRLAHSLDAVLEPWTMRRVDGLIAVSEAYIATLCRRYPWIDSECCVTLPFGASARDFEVLPSVGVENHLFRHDDGFVHGVYIGRGGDDMARALRILFTALNAGLSRAPDLYNRIRLHFVGTDYAPSERARKTVEPVARQFGVRDYVSEQTARLPYFETLRLLQDADFLVVIGSDDPQYTASKIYPYVLARRPMIAVLHEESSAGPILQTVRAGVVATFGGDDDMNAAASLATQWTGLLARLPCAPDIDWTAFEPYTAREMTRRQCELFDKVVSRRRAS